MSTVTLGFQTNAPGANITYFNIAIPKDGKEHKLPDLIGKATSGGNPVKIPADFLVNEVQLNKPAELSATGSVEVKYPSGSLNHRASVKLRRNKTDVKVTATLGEVSVTASTWGDLTAVSQCRLRRTNHSRVVFLCGVDRCGSTS